MNYLVRLSRLAVVRLARAKGILSRVLATSKTLGARATRNGPLQPAVRQVCGTGTYFLLIGRWHRKDEERVHLSSDDGVGDGSLVAEN